MEENGWGKSTLLLLDSSNIAKMSTSEAVKKDVYSSTRECDYRCIGSKGYLGWRVRTPVYSIW